MADTNEQLLGTITPIDSDYFRAVDNPGGTPVSSNVTGTALKAYLKAYNDTLYYGKANVVFTTSDFNKISDVTLSAVTQLEHTVVSGGKYRFSAMLLTTTNVSGGAKVALSGTATATITNYRTEFCGTSTYSTYSSAALDNPKGETTSVYIVKIFGYIDVNAGGTLLVQFAQNASYATASIVKTGSWFEVEKIG